MHKAQLLHVAFWAALSVACEQAHVGAQRERGIPASVKLSGEAARRESGTSSIDSFRPDRFSSPLERVTQV